MLTVGEKVKVVDKRDGAVIMRGSLKAVEGDTATVAGVFNEEAFGELERSLQDELWIMVPLSCVEKEQQT